MAEIDEDLIRKRAYALWEAEGRPADRHDAHWEQAYSELAVKEGTSVLGEPEENQVPAAPEPAVVEASAPAETVPKRKRKPA